MSIKRRVRKDAEDAKINKFIIFATLAPLRSLRHQLDKRKE